ncbi:hypothetical protein GYMLUDRAFT_62298 [Collybiopsis luxurians FD-317 M1]|uniref:Uncharacterized protein n=1 Tax=Collybiopsis luxurians FD-317 M1 TaxID=944289 RepID=A0A0D0CLM9_9AGAR|nr:hypothetical protein GYMLUDRAFT_62298 [Collybiopsis luxurians FD-317 M1]
MDGDGYYKLEPVDDAEEWDAQAEIYPTYAGLSHSRPGFNCPNSSRQTSVEALVPITNEPINLYSDRENHHHPYTSDPGDDLTAVLDGVSQAENHPTDYENFLERVDQMVVRDRRQIPDPFLDGTSGRIRLGGYSRMESSESIASIVDSKSDSPLNKAIASVSLHLFLA